MTPHKRSWTLEQLLELQETYTWQYRQKEHREGNEPLEFVDWLSSTSESTKETVNVVEYLRDKQGKEVRDVLDGIDYGKSSPTGCNHETGAIEYHNNAIHCTQCQAIFTLEEWKAMRFKSSPTEVPVGSDFDKTRPTGVPEKGKPERYDFSEYVDEESNTHTSLPELTENHFMPACEPNLDTWVLTYQGKEILLELVNTLSKKERQP